VTQTRLPLELQSVVVVEEHPEASTAIVAQRGKGGIRYKIGETVPGNAKLEEVLQDRIILRRAGQRETLMFPQAKHTFAVRDEAPQDAPEATEASPQSVVDDYQAKLASDPDAALSELGIEAVEPGNSGGYRIGNVAQSPYLRNTGLQNGDVILSVNGRSVGDVSQDRSQLASIFAEGSARIEVQRGSRRFFITASLPSTVSN